MEIRIGVIGNVDSGKCLGRDTLVMMHKGELKKVQDIKRGDLLVGDDGRSRKVLNVTSGKGQLYIVKQTNADALSYVINDKHILTLLFRTRQNSRIIDIPVEDYLNLNEKIKARLFGFKVPVRSLRNSPKSRLITKIDITDYGIGEYYGFTLSDNGRFLLSDFTVTHNSSSISCLTYDILDDGRGLARKKVLYHPHEQETGRTSSISKIHLKTNDKDFISFVDLAGHEKYLRTTLHGLTGYNIDYAMVVIGSNMGISKMTREHLSVVVSLRIPVFILVTKIDICPSNILEETLSDLETLLGKTKSYKLGIQIENTDQVNQVLNLYRNKEYFDMCPIFLTSNKTGQNLDLVKHFLHNLPVISPYIEDVETRRQIFRVQEKFLVKGVGIVVSGICIEGMIKKGDHMFIGPIMGQWTKVTIKGLHDNFRNDITEMKQNMSGCLALNFQDKKIKMTKYKIKKGIIVADIPYNLTRNFEAKIAITTGHSTTISTNYQPIINCKTIVQAARIYGMDKNVVRSKDVAVAKLRFSYRPEFVNIGDIFIFREGNLRGIGKITNLLPDDASTVNNVHVSRRKRRREKLNILQQKLQERLNSKK